MSRTLRGITIEIGGNTQRLQDSLRQVNSRSTELQTELKAVDRLLKLDPTNTDLLTQRQQILAGAVGSTRERLQTLTEAQRQVAEQFARGEAGEEQYRAIQREVIAAQQELERLEDTLESANSRWETAATRIGAFGNKAQELGEKFAPVSAAAGAVVVGMAGMAVKAGQAADDLNTLSKQTGISTDTLQRFRFASDTIDVSVETLTGSLTKLTRNMGAAKDGNANLQDGFKKLGVEIVDSSGNLRDNEDVLNDTIAALGQIANETERDALAMELLGKSAQDLNPLILGGADALKKMGDEAAAAGLILSQDALDAANEFNDELDLLKATASSAFMQMGVDIGQVLLPVLKELAEGLKIVMDWVKGLDETTLKWILVIAGLVAAIAPLLMIIGQVALGISAVMTAVKFLAPVFVALTSPIGLVIIGITALVAALVYLWTTNEEFRGRVIKVWEEVREFFVNLWIRIRDIFANAWRSITENFAIARDTVFSIAQNILDGISGRFSSMISRIREIVAGVTEAIATPFRRAAEIVSGITSKIGGFLQRINPFARFSPSLVDNVRAGVRVIQEEYSKLEQLDLPRVSTMAPQTAGAGAGANAITVPGIAEYHGPLINVQNMNVRSEADIENISRQLYRHIQTGIRAKGGR